MDNYFLYIHKNKVNGKVYVGITGKKDVSSRWRKDGSGYRGSYFYNAILKYGWDNFEHIVLYSNLTKEDAIRLEQETISKFNSNNRKYGYNLTSGGEITTYNEEARRRIREKCLGRKSI